MKILSKMDSLDNVQDGNTRKLITKTTSSGTGNVVSSVSVSGDTITYTKGVNALTAHQNAFSTVKVGSTNVAADQAGDTLELVAGSNVTLTPDATNDKVTIAATDTNTTYTFATGDANGQIKVTPSNGSAQNIDVKGLGNLAYKNSLSKSDVGLSNVDNTSDVNKPISTATQSALDKKAKYLSLGSCADFQRVVVGLCELSANANSGTSSHTSGSIVTIRFNGLVPEYVTNFVFQDQYSGAKSCNYSFMGNFENTSTALRQGEGFRACTFTYNNKYYGGLEFYQTQARSFYWYGESNFTPFLVAYYNFSTGDVLNSEINNSIVHTGSVLNRKNILADEAKKATGDKDGNDITTTYYKASNPSGYTSNIGTITGITMNGASKGTSGVVDLGTVLTSHQSIKTINNNTITGTGNVSVGTITKVQANGTDVASSGTANIPAASTSAYGVTKLSNATDSTSEVLAATPKAVKAAYDLAASKGTGTITGVSVNWSSVATSGVANITNIPTNILSEPRFRSSATPTTRTLFHTVRANRLAFLPADQIIVEKSTDAGATWQDAGWNDATKKSLFTGLNSGGGAIPLKDNKKSTDCILRITISAMKYNVPEGTAETNKYSYWSSANVKSQERYCTLHTMYFWVNAVNDQIWLKVERASGANPNNWSNIFDSSSNANRDGLVGWSGMDFITFGSGTFGGGTTQTSNLWNYRLTFRTCSKTKTSDATLFDDANLDTQWASQAQSINGICGYGDNCWGSPNSLMSRDHLYSWDADQNAIFPKDVKGATVTSTGALTAGSISTSGAITASGNITTSSGDILLTKNATSGGQQIKWSTAANDYARIYGAATASNAGYLEIATADDSNEPIYARQYTGQFGTLTRTATLLDASGNTSFPGTLTANKIDATKLDGAIPSAVTATTQTQGDNSTKLATTAYVDTALNNLPEPMVFKGSLGTGGTITSLPTAAASNEGWTYKVITAGTYASQSAKVGDTFISDGSAWILIPSGDEPSGTVTSITIKGSSPITVDSESAITTSGTRTISHANSGVTAGTYRSVTVNATGHVTAGTNPTTLSGYGITDAKIDNGVITLGSNTITPLTQHQDINGKLDKSGGAMTGAITRALASSGTIATTNLFTVTGSTDGFKVDYAANTADVGVTTLSTTDDANAKISIGNTVSSTYKEAIAVTNGSAVVNGYTVAEAAGKAVVTSIDTSASLPTSNAVKTFVEGKNYNYSVDATVTNGTIDDLAVYTSGKPGMTGSINLTKKDSGVGSQIAAGWYNFIFSPHRTGSGGDNPQYGNIILMPMNFSGTSYILRRNASTTAITEVNPIITTDTKNTAGSTDTSSKIFLIGATSQAANPQTYSDNEVYATSGILTTKSVQVGGTAATMQYNSTDKCIEFVFA